MSILSDPLDQKIRPNLLKAEGYSLEEWGNPRYCKTHNTKNYNLYDEEREIHIIWFPKDFDGVVNLGGMCPADVKSRVMIEWMFDSSYEYWLSPRITTMFELHTFIEQVLSAKIASNRGNYWDIN